MIKKLCWSDLINKKKICVNIKQYDQELKWSAVHSSHYNHKQQEQWQQEWEQQWEWQHAFINNTLLLWSHNLFQLTHHVFIFEHSSIFCSLIVKSSVKMSNHSLTLHYLHLHIQSFFNFLFIHHQIFSQDIKSSINTAISALSLIITFLFFYFCCL